jgi:hypothetical protein
VSKLDLFRRQAKQLVRWHRAGNHSVGGRIRILPRYRDFTDAAALALRFPLAEAQEVTANENGYESWGALKTAAEPESKLATSPVRTRQAAAEKRNTHPPCVKRAGVGDLLPGQARLARLHLRFAHEAPFVAGVLDREQVICAFVEVEDIKRLCTEYLTAGVDIPGRRKKEPWGRVGIAVRDPDANPIYFVWQPPAE